MSLVKDFKTWIQLKDKEIELQNLAIGINSTVDFTQDKHIVMLDYDIKDLQQVRESVKEIQLFWNLSDAEIFKTRNGHHVFFWYDQIPYGRLRQIIEFARYVDPMYKYISRFYDHKTIRVAGKYKEKDIEFVEKISGRRKPTEMELSLGALKKSEHSMMQN